jgi:hypothetical protein
MDSTEKYIADNKKAFSTKNRRKKNHLSKPKANVGGSFFNLFKFHFKSCIRSILFYPFALYQGRGFLGKTLSLSGSAINRRALVIGNGPSQGYLEATELNNFVKEGGETLCVNSWYANEKLSNHVPSWMLFSDPLTFDKKEPHTEKLINYLKNNSSIKIIVPTNMIKKIQDNGLKNQIFCFVDLELSIWRSINPLFPRGYMSLTLYKALAWSIYLGYNSIGVIGMDNTLPKNIYNNEENRVHFIANQAGTDDCLVDVSSYHSNVASYYYDVFKIFHHLEYFPNKNIFNLDPYSLTDRFRKVNKKNFFEEKIN